ncbi:MAG: DUF2799 domain-containing protein [Desulfobulbaceae bacterium]|nr:DUF2799 domain-containing protein [Desulfobulbaceae bacterium]
MKAVVSCVLAALLLAGCATLSREQCQRGDWFGLGITDGQNGQPASRLDQHSRACSEHGIHVDNQQYLNGRAQGLQDYCQIENAFDSGLEGRRYQQVCPPSIDAAFERYNRAAYEVYQIRKELEQVDDRIRDNEHRLWDKDLSDDNRRRIRSTLRDLDRQRDRVRHDLYSSEQYLDRLMDEAKYYRNR